MTDRCEYARDILGIHPTDLYDPLELADRLARLVYQQNQRIATLEADLLRLQHPEQQHTIRPVPPPDPSTLR